jgi:hypothetical protein
VAGAQKRRKKSVVKIILVVRALTGAVKNALPLGSTNPFYIVLR